MKRIVSIEERNHGSAWRTSAYNGAIVARIRSISGALSNMTENTKLKCIEIEIELRNSFIGTKFVACCIAPIK